jgi:hypothetical protein
MSQSDEVAYGGISISDETQCRRHASEQPYGMVRDVAVRIGAGIATILAAVVGAVVGLAMVAAVVWLAGALPGHGGRSTLPLPPVAVNRAMPPVDTTSESSTVLTPIKVLDSCPMGSTSSAAAFSDGKDGWVCQRSHGVDGTGFEVYFDGPVVITSITITPGGEQHRTATRILWRLGDKQLVQDIAIGGSTMKVPDITTISITGVVQKTAAVRGADDAFAIGKIVVTGYPR